MKTTKTLILAILATIAINSSVLVAEPPPEIKTSPAFNKLKQLIGDWKGKMTRSTGEVIELELNYKLTSNNSVIMETAIEDGVEMITTYRDRFGKLTATHYCALGNQPMFNLATMTDTTLDFEFDPQCGLKEGEHKYVKDWKVIHDPNTADVLTTEYVVINEDKSLEDSAATLKRVK
ncbi:hypothetical protein N9D23_12320 [Rubripirellula sp.]|nr:hypothetical protein [Planctomycetaceae bacterium]MDA9858898.1 hypothetical protein [Rubripirellula sp.]